MEYEFEQDSWSEPKLLVQTIKSLSLGLCSSLANISEDGNKTKILLPCLLKKVLL